MMAPFRSTNAFTSAAPHPPGEACAFANQCQYFTTYYVKLMD
jgi:hypothetical protein